MACEKKDIVLSVDMVEYLWVVGGEDESGTSGVSRGRCEQVDDHIDKLAIQVVLNFVYQQVASVP